ncbi:hypothetical protein GCM10022267_09450 [Lentzea roselyniae]|uniref:ATP-grasp target RiPP n=1 Tax=Lentzea roselyniae TaxID=531940 RepID=A0ABP7A5M8_9PSEU
MPNMVVRKESTMDHQDREPNLAIDPALTFQPGHGVERTPDTALEQAPANQDDGSSLTDPS